MRRIQAIILFLCIGMTALSFAQAIGPNLAPAPPTDAAALVGDLFISHSGGIAFKGLTDSREIRKGTGDDLVEYINDGRNWQLRCNVQRSSQPISLRDDKTQFGQPRPGLLTLTADQFRSKLPGSEILRQDVIPLTATEAGMIAVRYTEDAKKRLTQQAIIQASDQLYYFLTLTTPGAAAPPDDPRTADVDESKIQAEDPGERLAVEAFRIILDSVRLLDRGAVKEDQDQRLFRTRALLVNWSEEYLRRAVVPEQWLRLMRDGKDIGYTYAVEEISAAKGTAELVVSVYTFTTPEPGVRMEATSQMAMTMDRRHESWAHVVRGKNENEKHPDKQDIYASEYGTTDVNTRTIMDRRLEIGEGTGKNRDEKQPQARLVDVWNLQVTYISKGGRGEPKVREDLPPWYLPQALGYMLPRLLPLREPKGLMFAGWVSERGEVMSRYIDVAREREIHWNGRVQRVVAISDRIGLEGSVTMHYLSPSGRYLGSQNQDSGMMILPSDPQSLTKMWHNPKLTKPQAPQPDAPPASTPAPAAATGSNGR